MGRVKSRVVSAVAALAVVATMATGCLPQPAPEPTPAFSSEKEAFAAAEATYRAYVDAVNARRENERAEPDPASFLSASALEAHIETQQEFDQNGVHLTGDTSILGISEESADLESGEISITVCLDSSDTHLVDENGNDVTPTDRPELTSIAVTMRSIATNVTIEKSDTRELGAC